MTRKLTPEECCRRCDPAEFDFDTTSGLVPREAIIGQERATQAMDFGLSIKSYGFNLFVSGLEGTGRHSIVQSVVEQFAAGHPVPDDWCYVANLRDADCPRAISLPPGMGRALADDMRRLVEDCRRDVPRALEQEAYRARQAERVRGTERQKAELAEALTRAAAELGFALRLEDGGIASVPLVEGRPAADEAEVAALPEARRAEIAANRTRLEESARTALGNMARLDRQARAGLEDLEREAALAAVEPHFAALGEEWAHLPEVAAYLEEMREELGRRYRVFLEKEGEEERRSPEDPLLAFRVNPVVDHFEAESAPVVYEPNPTFGNLIGVVEKKQAFGQLYTDFTLIKAGALLRASGGYLILEALALVRQPIAWEALKRALRQGEVVVEDLAEQLTGQTVAGLRPQPIPIRTKILLVGTSALYRLLHLADREFPKLFKVHADFQSEFERDERSIASYAEFAAGLASREGLQPLDRGAVARLVEEGSRIAGRRDKLTTRFGLVADVVREASFYARKQGRAVVGADEVRQAIAQRDYRSNRIQEKLQELIAQGLILVSVSGERVGQVNGLSVLQLGTFSFGRPNRITCRTYLGREGVVNIERQARLSGRSHDKGVLILSGYLAGQYAGRRPLSLGATVGFEQSYGMIDGDSASAAELVAILSSLAAAPVRQDVAITGSVNQHGEIQPIGGVNEKVEGFFHTCRTLGWTGRQGVAIPRRNLHDLMLADEVVEAVRGGSFSLWALETIEDALALLTGLPIGARGADGAFPEGTLHRRVDDALERMAQGMKQWGRPDKKSSG